MEANKKRFIRVAGELIEVTKEVYLTYYRGKRREKAQHEKEQYHHVVSFDALDTEGLQGAQMIAKIASPEPEDIVIAKIMCEKLHACNGRDYSPLISISQYCEDSFFSGLLDVSETFDEKDKHKQHVTVEDKLKQVYDAIFGNTFRNGVYTVSVGKLEFEEGVREKLLRAAGLLSVYSNYTF